MKSFLMESLTPNLSNPALKVKKKKKRRRKRGREKNLEMLNKHFGQGLLPYNLFFKQE